MGDTTEGSTLPRPSDDDLRTILDQHRAWAESNGRDGARADLSGMDLSGADLDGANLASAQMAGANLAGAKLNGADLSGAYLVRADLSGAELNLTNLTAARLTDATLTAAELCRADLSGAYLERANLERANLDHAALKAADLSGANLTKANLFHADLSRADLTRAVLVGADLSHAEALRADFTRADLTAARLYDAILTGANFLRAELSHADLTQTDLSGAVLRHADLSRARMKHVRLENADLRNARVQRFDQSFVRGAQFSALSSRWRVFLCEAVCGPLALWFRKRGWERASAGVKFTADHNDAWTVLRQSYAGPRVTFLFFTVIAFATPYIGRAVVLSAAAPIERQLMEHAKARKPVVLAQLAAAKEGDKADLQIELTRIDDTIVRFEQKKVWKVLLNWDKGPLWPSLAGLLILYNIGIYVLITSVSALRDEEERSGWTPAWREYRHLIWVHRAVVLLFYVSVASFGINVGSMLGEEIIVPKLG